MTRINIEVYPHPCHQTSLQLFQTLFQHCLLRPGSWALFIYLFIFPKGQSWLLLTRGIFKGSKRSLLQPLTSPSVPTGNFMQLQRPIPPVPGSPLCLARHCHLLAKDIPLPFSFYRFLFFFSVGTPYRHFLESTCNLLSTFYWKPPVGLRTK